MKYLMCISMAVLLFTVGVASGVVSATYDYSRSFEKMTNVAWQDFVDTHDNCVEVYATECSVYGGFAPRDQVSKAPRL